MRCQSIILGSLVLLVLFVSSCAFSDPAPSMVRLQSQGKSIAALAFQPDRQRLALVAGDNYGGDNQWIELWDLANQKLEKTYPLEQGDVTSVAFRPDGLMLATAGNNGAIHLYDSEDLTLQTTLALTTALQSLSFSPDGTLVAAKGERTIGLWEVATQRLVQTLPFTPTSDHRSVPLTFSRDGQLLATQDDNAITLWQVRDGKVAAVVPFADPGLCGVTLVPRHSVPRHSVPQRPVVASCRRNGNIELIDSATNKRLQQIDSGADATLNLAFAPDGQLFAASGVHGNGRRGVAELPVTTLGLYRVTDGQLVVKFDVVTGAQYEQVTISPNGEWLAIFSANEGDVRLLPLRAYTQPQ